MIRLARVCILLLVLGAFTTLHAENTAQDATCGALVQQAMREVETVCGATGRNQACYGYIALEATPREGVTGFSFRQEGDLANVADLASVQLSPLDSANNTWGVLMMKLQASLPETLPGQNVTFLLFGDVEIRNAVDLQSQPTLQPMQAFYFQTGITETGCTAAPADGILIQTPNGAGKVNLRANGVDVQLGSTAFVFAQPQGTLKINLLEGAGVVRADGKTVVVPSGAAVEIPLDDNLEPSGEPGDPYPYDLDSLENLPIGVLPEEFEIDDPASEDELLDAAFESDLLDAEHDELELEGLDPFSDEDSFEDEDSLDDESGDDASFEDEDGSVEDDGSGDDSGGSAGDDGGAVGDDGGGDSGGEGE